MTAPGGSGVPREAVEAAAKGEYERIEAKMLRDLLDAVRALTAQRDAALALHHAGHDDVADKLGIDPYPGDVCVECGSTFPCSTARALGASPVAADPPEEPKRYAGAFFEHIEKYGSPELKAAARQAEQELAADPQTEESQAARCSH